MKTSVNMVRKLGMFNVIQRTEDSYFEANRLLLEWNNVKHATRRRMDDFLNSSKTKEFIEEIEEQESNPVEKNLHTENQAVVIIKGRKTKNGQTPNRVFMHPYLFIDFAMWLNPKFKYHVIKFVYDQLIDLRHTAGDQNNLLRYAVAAKWHPLPEYFRSLNMGLNHIVFGKHVKGIRNTASEEQLNDLNNLQNIFVYNVKSNIITNEKKLLLELRKEYARRYVPEHKGLTGK